MEKKNYLENLGIDVIYRSNQKSNIDLMETGGGKWVRLAWLRIRYRGSLLFIR